MIAEPLATIPVGVVVERVKGATQWSDYVWRPIKVLAGVPETPPWTKLSEEPDRVTYYVGSAEIELHRTESGNYRDNLATGSPEVWVVLRETDGEPPYRLHLVTADPAEGEAMTQAGNDLVEAVPMPDAVRERVAAFVAEHHVEEKFVKRKRDRADPEALARREPKRPRGA